MSLFTCPHCQRVHYSGDHPDHLYDSGGFNFKCDCGATFDCDVDCEPTIHVRHSSLTLPETRKKRA